jgi:hypothetical protein
MGLVGDIKAHLLQEITRQNRPLNTFIGEKAGDWR